MSVDLSGEITAIATAVLAVFAIVTAVLAYLAFRSRPGKSVRSNGRSQTSRKSLHSKPS